MHTRNKIPAARIIQRGCPIWVSNSVLYGLIIAANDTPKSQQATVFCIISSKLTYVVLCAGPPKRAPGSPQRAAVTFRELFLRKCETSVFCSCDMCACSLRTPPLAGSQMSIEYRQIFLAIQRQRAATMQLPNARSGS